MVFCIMTWLGDCIRIQTFAFLYHYDKLTSDLRLIFVVTDVLIIKQFLY